MKGTSQLSAFVKYHREQSHMTQEELANKAGVGLRFIRDLEQGKETLRIDKVNAVLALFGFELKSDRIGTDPYEVWLKYLNKGVIITTKKNQKLYGMIIEEILDETNKINGWYFVPSRHAIEFQKTQNKKLARKISHGDIAQIELQ